MSLRPYILLALFALLFGGAAMLSILGAVLALLGAVTIPWWVVMCPTPAVAAAFVLGAALANEK